MTRQYVAHLLLRRILEKDCQWTWQMPCKQSKTVRGVPDCMKATFEVCHPRNGKLSAIWGYLLIVEGDG